MAHVPTSPRVCPVLVRTAIRASPPSLLRLLSRGNVLRLGLLAPGHPVWVLRPHIGGGRDACGQTRGGVSAYVQGCGTLDCVSAARLAHGGGLMIIQVRASEVKTGLRARAGIGWFPGGPRGICKWSTDFWIISRRCRCSLCARHGTTDSKHRSPERLPDWSEVSIGVAR